MSTIIEAIKANLNGKRIRAKAPNCNWIEAGTSNKISYFEIQLILANWEIEELPHELKQKEKENSKTTVTIQEAIKAAQSGKRVRLKNQAIWTENHWVNLNEQPYTLFADDILAEWEIEEEPLKLEFELKDLEIKTDFISQGMQEIVNIGGCWHIVATQIKEKK